ncbi:MAG: ABC transporter permease [Spirochaetaceae bacterium]|jgi:ribose transport system permease protein|nr:ABC transporter permease [Spirochaetaceae bacterium]
MPDKIKNVFKGFNFREHGVLIGFIVLCTIIGFLTPDFLSVRNILNLLRQSSIIGIISMGMTFVIISGNFDISVGAICGLSGAVVMKLMTMGVPIVPAILIALAACMCIGLVNGISVAKIGIPSLIATMAMVTILKGSILIITGGYPISNPVPAYTVIAQSYVGFIPTPIILFLFIIIIAQFTLTKTKIGSHVYSVGGNQVASRLSGINVDKQKILVFVINGFAAGLAGIILSSRVASATIAAGDGYDLDAIASVVIGGTSVSGGEGSALRTVLGVLLMAIIGNSFNLLGIDTKFQYIFRGMIILLAVGFDSYNKKKLQNV